MKLIFVSGSEATGKTYIAKQIARKLDFKYFSKDMYKEHLFDTESHSTWDYSWYENKAKDEFFAVVTDVLQNNMSVVIESNFNSSDKERLLRTINKEVDIAEVYCTSRRFVSFKRFVIRNESKVRHRGHHDRRWYANVLWQNIARMLRINRQHPPLGLASEYSIVDTTDFSKVDIEDIVNNLKFSTFRIEKPGK